MIPKERFVFLFSIGLFLTVGVASSLAFTASPSFQKRYDHYFPRNSEFVDGLYRKWFDRTVFNSQARGSLSKNDQLLYDAIRGAGPQLHKFLHSNYRTMNGEFGETWDNECLLLLLYLDDERFSDLLKKEDRHTTRWVCNGIFYEVTSHRNDFPKTHHILTLLDP